MTQKGLLLSDIDNAENAVKTIRVKLQAIGRELYKMREGERLEPHYHFQSYSRLNFSGPEYSSEEGPDWGVGTPIFSLCYLWSYNCGGDVCYVTFPQSWLEQDWRALEQSRLDKDRAGKAERDRIEADERARNVEAAERRTFERLKAKFAAHPKAEASRP